MRAVFASCLALCGCTLVFPLREPFGVDAPDAPDDTASACAGYDEIGTSRYKFILTKLEWQVAAQTCVDDGAHLAVPDTMLELTRLQAELGTQTDSLWLGIARDTQAEATNPASFRNVTGGVAEVMLWVAPEPDNNGGTGSEYAVRFGRLGGLVDVDPHNPQDALCECDGKPVTETFDWAP